MDSLLRREITVTNYELIAKKEDHSVTSYGLIVKKGDHFVTGYECVIIAVMDQMY